MSKLDDAIRLLTIKNQMSKPESLYQRLHKKDSNSHNYFDKLIEKIKNFDFDVIIYGDIYYVKVIIDNENIFFKSTFAMPLILYVTNDFHTIDGTTNYCENTFEERCPVKYDSDFTNLGKLLFEISQKYQSDKWTSFNEKWPEFKKLLEN